MNDKIKLVTTTSSIEGWSVQKYYGVVTYQLVIGANIFRDVFSSFRDIFGGTAKGYQKDLQNMEEIALDNLKKKASHLGANLILGLRLDFDEVSGGGKSMFMLSVSGTAAFGIADKAESVEEKNELISFDKLDFEIEREQLKEKVFADTYSIQSTKEIENLLEYKIDAIEKVISYIENYPAYYDQSKELITEYFNNVSKESINNFLMSNLFLSINKETFERLIELLETTDWFDYEVIFSLLKKDNPIANVRTLYLLEFENNYYSKDDIAKLSQLIELIQNAYQKYPIIQSSKGMLGKEKEKWECLNCGTKNPKESNTCSKFECQANIYGIPRNKINPERLKKSLSIKINKLKQMLNVT
jgi:uncharacterized protein YbjQ (UPF0145 family)